MIPFPFEFELIDDSDILRSEVDPLLFDGVRPFEAFLDGVGPGVRAVCCALLYQLLMNELQIDNSSRI